MYQLNLHCILDFGKHHQSNRSISLLLFVMQHLQLHSHLMLQLLLCLLVLFQHPTRLKGLPWFCKDLLLSCRRWQVHLMSLYNLRLIVLVNLMQLVRRLQHLEMLPKQHMRYPYLHLVQLIYLQSMQVVFQQLYYQLNVQQQCMLMHLL